MFVHPLTSQRRPLRSRHCCTHPFQDPMSSQDPQMEINHHISHIQHKDLPSGPAGMGLPVPTSVNSMNERDVQLQLLALKQQQAMQQAMLVEQFQQQQDQMMRAHQKQMQEHLQVGTTSLLLPLHQQRMQYVMIQKEREYLQQQKLQEEQRRQEEQQRREEQRLNQLKNKNDDQKSAIASSEVKQKLAEHLLNKKQREVAAAGKMTHSPPQYRHWPTQHHSLEQHSPPQSGLSPPYRPPMFGEYEDYPLRKTASEPNLKLVRSRLKQKVIQRSSPLLRRRDLCHLKRRPPLTIDTTLSGSNPDSGPNSPPSSGSQMSGGDPSCSTTPAKEEAGTFPLQLMSKMVNQSMPNISVGRPHKDAGSPDTVAHAASSSLNEAELRALAYRQGIPIPPGHMITSGTVPFYPTLPVIDGEFSNPASPVAVSSQMKVLEQQGASGAPMVPAAFTLPVKTAISDPHQVAQARLNRGRPLARTHSAPLPLPVQHPLLNQQQLLLQAQEPLSNMSKESQKLLLKQRLQNTVLQRVGSKNHMENVDEETEAKLAQEMKESLHREDEDVVIVSDTPEPPHGAHPPAPQVHEVEGILQPRELLKLRQQSSLGGIPSTQTAPPRPLARAQSSPLVTCGSATLQAPPSPESVAEVQFTTGIAYDNIMLKHQCVCGNNGAHPEHAGRLQSISARLHETGLLNKCEKVKSRKATIEELQTCHSEAYTLLYGTSPLNRQKLDTQIFDNLPARFCMLPCGGVGVDSDTVWNDQHTPSAARMATGCVIELACQVALGHLKNGMALVRPPGHHAERDQAMGFCYFNSVAIAAKLLHDRYKLQKILVVDWDVHHGNSTQQIFYSNPNVLYLSLHRHDNGNFFPGTGAPEECGADNGAGFNVNVAFHGALNPPMGDAEYLAAFRAVVMPIAREFAPDIVLVSAGFDAVQGHPAPLGGYQLSAACFGHMTQQLMTLANGKLVLVLEGGYNLPAICDASEMCIRALLGEEVPALREEELTRAPCPVAVEALEKVISCQMMHWPCVKRYGSSISLSAVEAQRLEREEADTVSALASLSMVRQASKEEDVVPEPMEES